MKVTLEGIQAKIKGETYLVLPDGRTTLCMLTLENGYTIKGLSACVDAAEFNLDLGRKYALEDAIQQIWPLEGYLLAEEMHNNALVRKEVSEAFDVRPSGIATLKKPAAKTIRLLPQQVQAMKDAGVWQVKEKRDRMIATMINESKKRGRPSKKAAPYGLKKDGTPKKRPGPAPKEKA